MKREQFVKVVEETESLLIITGTMGAGKTTVLGEASDILALRHIAMRLSTWTRSALPIFRPQLATTA
jgi:adenylate kinase